MQFSRYDYDKTKIEYCMIDKTKPVHLNDITFEKLKSQGLVLVDFWASWCAPCKAQDPILEELLKQETGNVMVGKVNVDDNRSLAGKLNIFSIPTLILFKDGKEIRRMTGTQPLSRLTQIIKESR